MQMVEVEDIMNAIKLHAIEKRQEVIGEIQKALMISPIAAVDKMEELLDEIKIGLDKLSTKE